MRSQSLFNFFTKVADVQTTPAGAVVRTGEDSPGPRMAEAHRQAVEAKRKAQEVSAPAASTQSTSKPLRRRDVNGRIDQPPAQDPSTQPAYKPLRRRDANGRVAPAVFKGGYAVDTGNKVDWSAKGDGHINIRGANFTDAQYAAYNNVRSALTTAIRQQEGVSPDEARQRAALLADQWAADQAQLAVGGKALNRWQHVEKPAPKAQPAAKSEPEPQQAPQPELQLQPTSQQLESITSSALNTTGQLPSVLGGAPSFITSEETPTLTFNPPAPQPTPRPEPLPALQPTPQQLESITSASPTNTTANRPLTLGGTPSFTAAAAEPTLAFNSPQPTPQPAPRSVPRPESHPVPRPESHLAPRPVVPRQEPQQPSNPHKDTVWTQDGISSALNKQKTQVADGLTAIPGYDGLLFRKDGDAAGGVYDRTGRQLTYQGKAINDALLRGDRNGWWEFWKDGDYGASILHNAHQAMQSAATSNYGDAEMNALGFTKVPGSRRWYRNAKGQLVDISGELAPAGTIEGQLSHGRTIDQRWRKDTSDPLGLFFDGERKDIGYL